MVNFDATPEEVDIIIKIAERVLKNYPDLDFMDVQMDIEATHSNGCRLRLKELLQADDFSFSHDINGILNGINRHTGKLDRIEGFVLRFSA